MGFLRILGIILSFLIIAMLAVVFLLVVGWIAVHMTLMLIIIILAGTIAWYYVSDALPGGRR